MWRKLLFHQKSCIRKEKTELQKHGFFVNHQLAYKYEAREMFFERIMDNKWPIVTDTTEGNIKEKCKQKKKKGSRLQYSLMWSHLTM